MVGAGQQRHVIAMLGQRIVAGNLVLGAMRLMRMRPAVRKAQPSGHLPARKTPQALLKVTTVEVA